MNRIFFILIFLTNASTFGQSVVGDMLSIPTATKFENEVILEAFKASSPNEAMQILEKSSRKRWAGAPLLFNLGNVNFQLGNYNEAIKFYKLALEKQKFFQAYKNLAIAYSANSETENARVTFAKVLAISGNSDIEALLWLSDYRCARGDYSSALALCNQALIHKPDDENIVYAKARFLLELNLFAEAESLAQTWFERTQNTNFLRVLTKAYLAQSNKTGAIATLTLARELKATNKADIQLLADLYFAIGAFEKAQNLYREIEAFERLENLAICAINNGELELAKSVLKNINKKSARYEKIAGVLSTRSGNNADAIKFLQNFVKNNPQDFEAVAELAEALRQENKLSESSAMFARLRADKNFSKTALYGLLRNALTNEHHAEALKLAKEISALYPDVNIKTLVENLENICNELEKSAQ